jgi:DNA methyltransferase 1-associated protein 1
MQFSQMEYDQHLKDSDWTQQETSYLFALLQEYDVRFVVAADRYAYTDPLVPGATKRRTVEVSLLSSHLIRADQVGDQGPVLYHLSSLNTHEDSFGSSGATAAAASLYFRQVQVISVALRTAADMTARETKRKQYASELFHLTAAEIAEEESLYLEIKRIEQNEKRYRADRDALLRSVMGLDSGVVNLDQANSEGVVGVDRVRSSLMPVSGRKLMIRTRNESASRKRPTLLHRLSQRRLCPRKLVNLLLSVSLIARRGSTVG